MILYYLGFAVFFGACTFGVPGYIMWRKYRKDVGKRK